MRRRAHRVLAGLLRLLAGSTTSADGILGDLLEARARETGSLGRPRALLNFARRLLSTVAHQLLVRWRRLIERRQPVRAWQRGDGFWFDARRAARSLLRAPRPSALAVVTMAIGIGTNAAVFTVVDTVLIRPLPYPEPDRLVEIWREDVVAGAVPSLPAPALEEVRAFDATFTRVEGWRTETGGLLTGLGEPRRVAYVRITPGLLAMFGVSPFLGRTTDPADGGARTAILSHEFWRSSTGADRDIVGSTITLDDEPHTVIGVMPNDVRIPSPSAAMLVPLAAGSDALVDVVARLQDDVPTAALAARLEPMMEHLRDTGHIPADTGLLARAFEDSFLFWLPGNAETALWLVLVATGVVVLIACANLASLRLSQQVARQRQLAVAVALGASRWRLLRQTILEAVLVTAAGGIAGLLAVRTGLEPVLRLAPEQLGFLHLHALRVDIRVATASLAVAVLAGVLAGLAGQRAVWSEDAASVLATTGHQSTAARAQLRIRALLVQVQIILSMLLLVGAGLLLKNYVLLHDVDPGYDSERLMVARLTLPVVRYPDAASRLTALGAIQDELRQLPSVTSVAVADGLPPGVGSITSANRAEAEGEGPVDDGFTAPRANVTAADILFLHRSFVQGHYFDALGIEVLEGRDSVVAALDGDDPNRVVVSESFARRLWPDSPAAAHRFRLRPNEPWLTVAGVVPDIRQSGYDAADKDQQMYLPLRTMSDRRVFFQLAVRTATEGASLGALIRAAIHSVDRDIPIDAVVSMRELLGADLGRQRFSLILMSLLAGIAAVLAGVGVYGSMAFTVAAKTREMGIRMALGADPGALLRAVLRSGLGLAAIGLTVGTAATFGVSRLARNLLFGIESWDGLVVLAVASLLLVVALAACAVPARRATRVDPLISLRAE